MACLMGDAIGRATTRTNMKATKIAPDSMPGTIPKILLRFLRIGNLNEKYFFINAETAISVRNVTIKKPIASEKPVGMENRQAVQQHVVGRKAPQLMQGQRVAGQIGVAHHGALQPVEAAQ